MPEYLSLGRWSKDYWYSRAFVSCEAKYLWTGCDGLRKAGPDPYGLGPLDPIAIGAVGAFIRCVPRNQEVVPVSLGRCQRERSSVQGVARSCHVGGEVPQRTLVDLEVGIGGDTGTAPAQRDVAVPGGHYHQLRPGRLIPVGYAPGRETRRAEVDRESGPIRRGQVLSRVETFQGRGCALVADQDPPEVTSRIIQPVLDIRHHSGCGAPGVETDLINHDAGAGEGQEIPTGAGPEGGIEERVNPRGVACRGGRAGALASRSVGNSLAPVGQSTVQGDGSRTRAVVGPGHVQCQGNIGDGGTGWNVSGDVEGEQGPPNHRPAFGARPARVEVLPGAVA